MTQTALLRLNGKEGKRTYFVFNPVSAVFRLFYNRFATIFVYALQTAFFMSRRKGRDSNHLFQITLNLIFKGIF
jgi:hypothetical protein